MPKLENIVIRITDGQNKALEEWGVQHIRGSKVSAYIESIPNMPFRISIQPQIPYAASFQTNKSEKLPQEDIPPFSLLATLYLDGRSKPERSLIVCLDPNNDAFPPNGTVSFKCRRVQGENRTVNEQAWVFKEVGIETILEKMALRDRPQGLRDPEDILVNALHESYLGGEDSQANEERRKVGQIVIKLERVSLGKRFEDHNYHEKHSRSDNDDVDVEGANQGMYLINRFSFEHLRTLDPKPVRRINYNFYVEGESPWATFCFFYRSQAQLQKFNFPGFPQSLKPDARRPNTSWIMTAPPRIVHPLSPAMQPRKRPQATFKKLTEEDSAEIGKPEDKYEFKDYRGSQVRAAADKSGKTASIVNSSKDPNNLQVKLATDREISTVVVKGKTCRRSKAGCSTRGDSSSSPGPSSTKSTDDSCSPSPSSLIAPPPNSPTTHFYDPPRDPRLPAPQGSQVDTFEILSDTSFALTKAIELASKSQIDSPSAIKDTMYRHRDYNGDGSDAEDERSDTKDEEDGDGDSDKENVQVTDRDDAGLHTKLKAVSLGIKRQRGECVAELEECEVTDGEEEQKGASRGAKRQRGSGKEE
ncbi:MAG: hypothetical protein Q9216_000058 [Gyalolechia sp. 2 TL-2023]